MPYQVYLSVTELGGVTKTVLLEKNKSLFVGTGSNCRLVLDWPQRQPDCTA